MCLVNFLLHSEHLFKSDGSRYKAGDVMKLPRLGDTFSRIAEQGGGSFYNGQLSTDIIADLREIGNQIHILILKNHHDMFRVIFFLLFIKKGRTTTKKSL